jgi:hypothetical protein
MRQTEPLTCRSCSARPNQPGDQVSIQATAYTCSRCLVTDETEGAAITLPGREKCPSSSPEKSGVSGAVFRHGRAGKSGRPRVAAEQQRQKARDRQRAYRARQKRGA